MVKGLEVFREHFRNFADRYVLIGGAACDIAMTGAGLPFSLYLAPCFTNARCSQITAVRLKVE
jgi:hypothetical protein